MKYPQKLAAVGGFIFQSSAFSSTDSICVMSSTKNSPLLRFARLFMLKGLWLCTFTARYRDVIDASL